jgi:hypothetical protein
MFPDWQRGVVPTLTFASDYPVAAFEPCMGAQKIGRIFRDSETNLAADAASCEHLAPGNRANEAIASGRYDTASGLNRPTYSCGVGLLRAGPRRQWLQDFPRGDERHYQPRLDQRRYRRSEQSPISGRQFDEFAQSRLHREP